MRPALVDVLLALVLTGLNIATLLSWEGPRTGPAFALAVLMAAPLALRQRTPVVTLTVIGAAMAAYSLLGHGDIPGGGVGLLIALFTVATLRPRPVVTVLWLATVAVLAIVYTEAAEQLAWPEYVQAGLIALGAWVLGESTRRWGLRTQRLAEQAARAAADERVRLARELHDVASHHMSVISLQAGMAEYVVDSDPRTAKEAMATVGDASRAALTEMRRLLDVLRVDDTAADRDPQPGLAMLDGLVARTRNAGLPVELTVTGSVRPLPPGPDLCAYRIAQESLTNVLKHAGPASARIDLDYGERTVTLRVSDDGTAARHGQVPAAAHGIRGMRERAELYGGVLTAGPAEDGGFRVVLRLPVGERR
ncbi:two-component sensor histidine kinase [Prauserella muralis]|uniref:histidine kinase n=1 Tax=Prauserella muralis TaxID=588067 RepID=A0A2V4AQU4_9PSEU|nr:two-component sensor histidine kinase [Prauserella muralis]